MSCSDNESVCSVKKENNLGYYRLHTIWKSDGFFLNVTSKDGAWRGEMTSSDVEKTSGQLNVEPKEYLKQCKEALTSHDGQRGMVYSVENGSFTWKRVVDEDSGIKIKMGCVRLEPTSFVDTIQKIVSAALNCNKKLEKELKGLNEENEKIVDNRNDLLNKLNGLIETKNKLESDLYSQFILLLNSKKKKIKQIERALESKKKKALTSKHKEFEEDPYEMNTDCEDDGVSEEKISRKSKPSIGDTSEDKITKNVEEASTSLSFPKSESEIPLTKVEVLEYFYGKS